MKKEKCLICGDSNKKRLYVYEEFDVGNPYFLCQECLMYFRPMEGEPINKRELKKLKDQLMNVSIDILIEKVYLNENNKIIIAYSVPYLFDTCKYESKETVDNYTEEEFIEEFDTTINKSYFTKEKTNRNRRK